MKTLNTTQKIIDALNNMSKEEQIAYFNGETPIDGEYCTCGTLVALNRNHGYQFVLESGLVADYEIEVANA